MRKIWCMIIVTCLLITMLPQKTVAAAQTNYNYGEALQKAIMFYEFQRSGKLPDNKRDNWRGDSGLNDGKDAGLDLTGGWYDAGDHVKFNLPMAYSQTMLAWAVYEAKDSLEKSGQLGYLTEEIKWVSDYLIKCHPSPNVYYYQVGSGNADHAWWGPAEVMQMERPSYKVTSSSPGSAVVGEAAAALASAAVVFQKSDPDYAAKCIKHAKELFTFADTTKSDKGYTAAESFYTSYSGYYDELSWAGAWLYIATGEESYLNKAEGYVDNWKKEDQTDMIAYKWAHSWDDKHHGTTLLLARITDKAIYKEAMERHLDYWTTGYNGNRITYTPKGLAWCDQWGALRYATTEAFLASVYADWSGCTASKADTYKEFAKAQVDYALGSTGRSFVVGYGTKSPEHPHHRTAHSSWADSQTTPAYHRHVIYGALVGGPGSTDNYEDSISNYVNNEIACDYNAGFVGALAKLYGEYGGTPVKNLTAVEKVTNDEFFVEAGINASGSNFIEIKALLNNQSGWPARMGDKLSFKYFIDISEAVKAGYSASDFTTSTNYNNGAKVSELLPWDKENNIYYVNADFTGTKIYPGGQGVFKREVQIRIAAPLNTTFWDNANDYSYADIKGITSGKAVKTPYIPVYDNGKLVYGEEPGDPVPSGTISKTTAEFDKFGKNQKDIQTDITLNGNKFVGIKNGTVSLVSGKDYTVSGNTVTLLSGYLSKQEIGTTKLTFDFSDGNDPVMMITVKDTTPSASISPMEALFDLEPLSQKDISIQLTPNGYTLEGIKNGTATLKEGTDYTVSEDTVTILRSYLAARSKGKISLIFDFSGGIDPVLTVTIKDHSTEASGDVKVEMFNGNVSDNSNGITPRFKLYNTGTTAVDLFQVKIRYYYTIDGEKAQTFWCDWSSAGSSNVTGTFVKMSSPAENADYYLEIGFKEGAGTFAPGQSVEIQPRFSKSDWTSYTQTNDYSFNEKSQSYAESTTTTVHISGKLQYGTEP